VNSLEKRCCYSTGAGKLRRESSTLRLMNENKTKFFFTESNVFLSFLEHCACVHSLVLSRYDVEPLPMTEDHPCWVGGDRRYQGLGAQVPRGESLKQCKARILPFW
jgi:hypothetical protein